MATYNITILGTSDTTGYKFSGSDYNGIIDSNAYDPTLTIEDGDSITFTFNQGALSHPFRISKSGQPTFGDYAGGDSAATWTPSVDGAWTYECTSHSSMAGTINVLSSTPATTTTTTTTVAPPPTTTTTTTVAPTTTTTTTTATPATTTATPATTTSAPATTTTTVSPVSTTTANPSEESEDPSCRYPFLQDRIKQFSYSTGTGNLELTETARGFSDFGEAYGDGDKFFYAITDGTRYEIGSGVLVTGVTNQIERHAIVTSNRNSNNIDFPQGKKEIFVTYPATNAVMMGSGICNHNVPQSNGIAYWESSHTLNYDSSLYWNDTLKRLGIRTNVPEYGIDVQGDGSNQSMVRASGFVVGPTGIHFPANNGDDSNYDGGIQYKHFLPNTIGDNNINAIIELSGDVNQILKIKSQNAGYFLAGPIPPDGCSSDCGSALPSFRSISMEDLPDGVADNQTTEGLQDQIDAVNAEIDTISGVVYGDLQDISRTFEFPVPSFSLESSTVSFSYPELANVNIASGYSLNYTIKECTFDSQTDVFLPDSVLLHHVNLTEINNDKYIHFNFYNNEEVIVGGGDALNESQHVFAATKPLYLKVHVDIDTENYPVSIISDVDTTTTTTTTTPAPEATVSNNATSPFTVNSLTVFPEITETTTAGSAQTDSRTFNISLPANIDNPSNDSVVLQVQKKHPSGELFFSPVNVATATAGTSFSFDLNLPISSANLSANDTFRTRVSFSSSSTDIGSVNSYSVDIKNTDVLNACIYHGGQNRFTGVFTDTSLSVESDPPDYSDKYTWSSRPPLVAKSFYALTRLPSSINMGHVIYTDCCISNNFFAINHRGDLYAWGENANGECGNGSTSRVDFPQKVATLKFVQVAGGRNSAIALTEDGHLYMWGLINGVNYTQPQLVNNTLVFTKISAYDKTYFALDDQNDVYMWGAAQTDNGNSIAPNASAAWIHYPSKLEFTPSINIDDISCGMNHLLFRTGSNLYSLANQSLTLEATDCNTQNDSFSAGNEVSIYANNSDVMLKGQLNGTSYSSYTIIPGKGKTIFASKVTNPIQNSFATMSNMSVYAAGRNCGFMTPARYFQNNSVSPYSIGTDSMVTVGEFFPHTFSFFPPYEQGRITLNADNFFFSARKAVYRNLSSTVSTSYVLDTYPMQVYGKSGSATDALSSNWGIMDMVTSGNVSSHYLRHWGVDHSYNPNQSNTPVTTTTPVPTTQPPPP